MFPAGEWTEITLKCVRLVRKGFVKSVAIMFLLAKHLALHFGVNILSAFLFR